MGKTNGFKLHASRYIPPPIIYNGKLQFPSSSRRPWHKNDAFEKLRFHANPSHTILKCGSPLSFTILGAVFAKNFSTPDEAKRRFRETSRSNSHLDVRDGSRRAQDSPKRAPRGVQEGSQANFRAEWIHSGFRDLSRTFFKNVSCVWVRIRMQVWHARSRPQDRASPPSAGLCEKEYGFRNVFFSGLLASPLDLRENEYGFRNGFF